MPRVGDTLEGRYEISAVLATGGMGVILQARHVRMGRDVAVKVLHPHIAQEEAVVVRFEREVRLAQRLNHPNTIRLYDFGEAQNGLVYVVMELLEGADLKEIIAQEGPLSVGRAVDLTLQMLDGLGEAHDQDFVHRDLKPSNLFITSSRRGEDLVKILDFGIAKSLEDTASDVTATGSICGTAAYVAPEYLHNASPHKAADVYAVGLILLEMLAGKRVFQGSSTAQTLLMQMQRNVRVPDPIAATPLGQIIETATHKDPSRRYQDADAMYRAINAVVEQLPVDLRLRPEQVGEVLAPAQGPMPSAMGNPAMTGAYANGDSSSALPQAGHTPATGEQSSPRLREPVYEDFGGEETLITPQPTPFDAAGSAPNLNAPAPTPPAPSPPEASGSTKKIGLIVAAAVLILGGVLAALMMNSAGDEAAQDAAGSAEPAAPEGASAAAGAGVESGAESGAKSGAKSGDKPAAIEFHIESSPVGATVYAGEERLGQTPLDRSFERDALPATLRIEKDGFEPATVDLDVDADKTHSVMLLETPPSTATDGAGGQDGQPAASDEPGSAQQEAKTREAKVHTSGKSKPAQHKASQKKASQKKASHNKSNKRGKSGGDENVDEFLDEYL